MLSWATAQEAKPEKPGPREGSARLARACSGGVVDNSVNKTFPGTPCTGAPESQPASGIEPICGNHLSASLLCQTAGERDAGRESVDAPDPRSFATAVCQR